MIAYDPLFSFRERPMSRFYVNGDGAEFTGPADTPLLWVLRDHLNLTGTDWVRRFTAKSP